MNILPENALVLVAVLPSKRDLDYARLLGWYRIPLKNAPKVISVDWLAFYQTAAFDKTTQSQISYVAEVTGHELVTRRELLRDEPDHPRAHEEYFKITLKQLQKLPHPIPAGKWRRITFFYTTGGKFQQAQTINDLVVKSEERQILWHSLRERALKQHEYHAEDLPEQALDPLVLALLGVFMQTDEKK